MTVNVLHNYEEFKCNYAKSIFPFFLSLRLKLLKSKENDENIFDIFHHNLKAKFSSGIDGALASVYLSNIDSETAKI